MNKSPKKASTPIIAAHQLWGVTIDNLQNVQWDDTESECMRQIVVYKLTEEGYTNKQISEIIDRSESTVQRIIYAHEQEIEDGYEGYIENVDNYEEMHDKIVRRNVDKAIYFLENN